MHPTRRPFGLRSVALIAVVIAGLTLSSIAFGAIAIGRPAPSLSSGFSIGNQELELAKASLQHGAGPSALLSLRGIASLLDPTSSIPFASHYTWSNLTTSIGAAPPAGLPLMTWDAADGYVLLYIGETIRGDFADTWTYSNATWTNITAATTGAPPILDEGGIAYDPSTSQVILFGGYRFAGPLTNYTWAYHSKTWVNLTSTAGRAPSPRSYIAMTTDSTDKEILLVGGQNASDIFQKDTWTFKNGLWANITSAQSFALPRMVVPILTDYPGHGAFLVGVMAYNSTSLATGTFDFSGGMWTNLTLTVGPEPAAIVAGAGFYVPSIPGIFAFGSLIFTPEGGAFFYPVTWEFVGGAWQNVTSITGTALDEFGELTAAAFDPADQSILTFSGLFPSRVSSSTWVLSAPPVAIASASKVVVDTGTPVSFSGTVSNGLAPNSVNWSFGDGSSASTVAASHAYSHAGVYLANLTATDFLGRSGKASVTIFVNAAPSVSLAIAPANPTAGSAVGFLPTVSGGAAPFTYAWSFGDGSSSTVAASSHTYSGSGSFTAKLTVTDAFGATANASLTVSVASAPSTTVSLTSGTGLYLLLGIILLIVIVVVLAALLARRPREPRPAATAYMATPSGGASEPPVPPGAA